MVSFYSHDDVGAAPPSNATATNATLNSGGGGGGGSVAEGAAGGSNLTTVGPGGSHEAWVPLHLKVAQTMFWVKVLYGLCMFPFAVFTVPIFSKALTGAYPTGYTKRGALAPLLAGSRYTRARAEQKDAVCCPNRGAAAAAAAAQPAATAGKKADKRNNSNSEQDSV